MFWQPILIIFCCTARLVYIFIYFRAAWLHKCSKNWCSFNEYWLVSKHFAHNRRVYFSFAVKSAKNKVPSMINENSSGKIQETGQNKYNENPFWTSIFEAHLELWKSFDWGTNWCPLRSIYMYLKVDGIWTKGYSHKNILQRFLDSIVLNYRFVLQKENPTQAHWMAFNFSHFSLLFSCLRGILYCCKCYKLLRGLCSVGFCQAKPKN